MPVSHLQSGLLSNTISHAPLADRMRPQRLEDYVGQQHLLATGKPLRRAIEQGDIHSMVLWGPPGSGKTTLARLMAHYCRAQFLSISAVLAGVKDVRAAVEQAQHFHNERGQPTILFVDEVHRFNKAQQDAFLPHIESGTLYFIGATTENPSFALNNALLSRLRVYVLKTVEPQAIVAMLKRALNNAEKGLAQAALDISEDDLQLIANYADGDVRRALTILEIVADLAELVDGRACIATPIIEEVARQGVRRFDKHGDVFYEQISALHKAVRGSAPNAALYWFCRMLDGGCDPLYIARRLLRIASEDIGNADPRALTLALQAWDVYQRLGSPEGELALAQTVLYLACAAKSNAVYTAYNEAMADAKTSGSLEVPLHLRNAPTSLMKDLEYGQGYRYAHDEDDAFAAGEQYFPEGMAEKIYYRPMQRGLEIKIAEKLAQLAERNARFKAKS